MRTPSSTARRAGRACHWRCLRRRVQRLGGSERRDDAEFGAADLCAASQESEVCGNRRAATP
eukprot:scaffold66299_cov52-Phaeocystis_antarctica.AAC.2